MRGAIVAAVGVLEVVAHLPARETPLTFLTVQQRDRVRARWSPANVSVSADGRYVAFSSYAALTPGDTDEDGDVYVLDRSTGTVALQSADVAGQHIMGDCGHARISADAGYVAFSVSAPQAGLVGSRTILRALPAGVSRWVARALPSDGRDGWSANPDISSDGRFIAFEAGSTDAAGSVIDVFRLQVSTGLIDRVSVANGGGDAEGVSGAPSISGDGRYVAFTSTADLIAPASPTGPRTERPPPASGRLSQVYIRDMERGETTRVAPKGIQPNGSSRGAVVSSDGTHIAFVSDASNLVPDDRNRSPDVFLHEIATGVTSLVSHAVNGRSANGSSGAPAISSDGRFVAFQSDASNLVCAGRCPVGAEDINLLPDVFLFDKTTGIVSSVSSGPAGTWIEESAAPALDATAGTVAFTSRHPIDARDVANDFDLFVRVGSRRERDQR